jgi:hypothetical protein
VDKFNIPLLLFAVDSPGIENVSLRLDQMEKYPIEFTPWPAFNYKPDVRFSIAHNGNNIFLKYYVEENSVAAIYRETNGPVYKDSCVEFFIDFNDGRGYYNIEFNCAGSCHIGFGSEKEDRLGVSNILVEKITHQALFKKGGLPHASTIKWELSLIIPVDVFYYHKLDTLKDQSCHINFYKCGDELPQPHYLSWVDMFSDNPNFHLPEFFKKAYFTGNEATHDPLTAGERYIENNV